jgi:hypothetical protein
MSRTPTYFTPSLEEQLAQLMKRMPYGEEVVISKQGIKLKKDGEERQLRVTSQRQPTDIDEYLNEFRMRREGNVELPKITGTKEDQVRTIMTKLERSRNNTTFEYYYLLGKLLKDYPVAVRKLVHQENPRKQSANTKLLNLAQKTEILFDTVGLSYLSLQKLRPRNLREMTKEKFESLMEGIREIVATRVETSSLLYDLIGDLTFPISQELNVGTGIVSPECEIDLNSQIYNPIIPE